MILNAKSAVTRPAPFFVAVNPHSVLDLKEVILDHFWSYMSQSA